MRKIWILSMLVLIGVVSGCGQESQAPSVPDTSIETPEYDKMMNEAASQPAPEL